MLEYKNFEIKAQNYNSDTKEMFVEGFASTFGNFDTPQEIYNPNTGDLVMTKDTIQKGAYAKTIEERGERIAFCLNHDIYDAKGKIVEIEEKDEGLWIKVRISDAEENLKTKIREGIYKEFSIGFKTINSTWEEGKDGIWIRTLTEIQLFEVSIVTLARDKNAVVTGIKSMELATPILQNLIKTEKNTNRKYQLMQLKMLLTDVKPNDNSLSDNKPAETPTVDFSKLIV